MKLVFPLLLALLPAMSGSATAESISFVAQVEDETLAEEAILLVHCLSDRKAVPWEFSGEIQGPHWLKVKEHGRQLVAAYRQGKKESSATFSSGGAEEACEKLAPGEKKAEPVLASLAPVPERAEAIDTDLDTPKSKTWIWVGAGAVAVAGFFLWKSHQPDHSSIQMK